MTAQNTPGEYLRARRELVDPAEVGLRVAGVRRTPGLRREEVATLAGGQLLVIYHAEPGSASALALSLLASGVTAGATGPVRAHAR
jgi:hypothetical protein